MPEICQAHAVLLSYIHIPALLFSIGRRRSSQTSTSAPVRAHEERMREKPADVASTLTHEMHKKTLL